MSDRGGAARHSDVEYVFEPHGSTQLPLREYIRDIWDRRQFVKALAEADLRGTRSNTVVGELWGVVDPLVQAAIYWFLFTVIRGSRGSVEYLTVVVAGVFFFNFTRIALMDGGRAMIKGKGLILNSTFPRSLLPIAAVYRGLLEFLPCIPVYIILHLALRAPIGPGIALLPYLFLVQVVLSMGLALLLSTAIVMVRDTSNLLNYIMRILIFVTPVIYPVSQLTPTLTKILKLNPLFSLFAAYQAIISGGVPSFGLIAQATLWAVFLMVVGVRTFRKHEHSFGLYL